MSNVAMSIYNSWALIVYFLFFVCIYCGWKAKRRGPLNDLPGPPPESFLLGTNHSELPAPTAVENRIAGNLRQLMREQVGSYDVNWQEIYGMVARIKAPFGVRRFFVPE
jgi:hypothetical protein